MRRDGVTDTAIKAGGASRRAFLIGAAALLGGCTTSPGLPTFSQLTSAVGGRPGPDYAAMYAAMPNEQFPVPAIDVSMIDPRYLRQEVEYFGPEPADTIVVDPARRFLYYVEGDNHATRYGVGVGREGLAWSGEATIQLKRAWPRWTPTQDMIAREPRYEQYADGMEPGLDNPLGARALYLFDDGVDTLYRLHGTNEPRSIGQAISSGCIRLFNQDVIHLYNRTPVGTSVIVREPLRDRVMDVIAG